MDSDGAVFVVEGTGSSVKGVFVSGVVNSKEFVVSVVGLSMGLFVWTVTVQCLSLYVCVGGSVKGVFVSGASC